MASEPLSWRNTLIKTPEINSDEQIWIANCTTKGSSRFSEETHQLFHSLSLKFSKLMKTFERYEQAFERYDQSFKSYVAETKKIVENSAVEFKSIPTESEKVINEDLEEEIVDVYQLFEEIPQKIDIGGTVCEIVKELEENAVDVYQVSDEMPMKKLKNSSNTLSANHSEQCISIDYYHGMMLNDDYLQLIAEKRFVGRHPEMLLPPPEPPDITSLGGEKLINSEEYLFTAPVHLIIHTSQFSTEFLQPSIARQQVMVYDIDGVDLCCHKTLCIMQFLDLVYMFDVNMGGEMLVESCKPALECCYITKVIHSYTRYSEALYFQFGIELHNVVDNQIAYSLVKDQEGQILYFNCKVNKLEETSIQDMYVYHLSHIYQKSVEVDDSRVTSPLEQIAVCTRQMTLDLQEEGNDGRSTTIVNNLIMFIGARRNRWYTLQFQNMDKFNIQLEAISGNRRNIISAFEILIEDAIHLKTGDHTLNNGMLISVHPQQNDKSKRISRNKIVHKGQKALILGLGCKLIDGCEFGRFMGLGNDTNCGLLMASIFKDTDVAYSVKEMIELTLQSFNMAQTGDVQGVINFDFKKSGFIYPRSFFAGNSFVLYCARIQLPRMGSKVVTIAVTRAFLKWKIIQVALYSCPHWGGQNCLGFGAQIALGIYMHVGGGCVFHVYQCLLDMNRENRMWNNSWPKEIIIDSSMIVSCSSQTDEIFCKYIKVANILEAMNYFVMLGDYVAATTWISEFASNDLLI